MIEQVIVNKALYRTAQKWNVTVQEIRSGRRTTQIIGTVLIFMGSGGWHIGYEIYGIYADLRNKGVMSKALPQVLSQWDAYPLRAWTTKNNIASQKVLKKVGFVRDLDMADDEYHSCYKYFILTKEGQRNAAQATTRGPSGTGVQECVRKEQPAGPTLQMVS